MLLSSGKKEVYEKISRIFHDVEIELEELYCEECDEARFFDYDCGNTYCAEELGLCPRVDDLTRIENECASFAEIIKEIF